ncbi:MAG TPA: SWIM zinc finger family protein [Polyangiaceae bacterium]|nr:SWIM zinc finger family protein [Polyangiaceae bacterium]
MIRPLSPQDLGELVGDHDELAKGTKVFHSNQLVNLARRGDKLYADCRGTSATPYRITLSFDPGGEVSARCTCPAARSRAFCKHAAAALVAWARQPGSFAAAGEPPPGAAGAPAEAAEAAEAADEGGRAGGEGGAGGRLRGETESLHEATKSKRPATDAAELMRRGVGQVEALVRDLATAGVASVSAERREQLKALAGALRQEKLRRLSGRVASLGAMLDRAAASGGALDAVAFVDLCIDMLLTARKVSKHLGGEALEARYVEELIGKTWTKTERAEVGGLDLVECAFLVTLAGDFVVRESRFVDLASGGHYSEKQIVPSSLRHPPEPKASHAGLVLEGAGGGAYPGFAPTRLDLERPGRARPLGAADLERLLGRALPTLGAAVAAFQAYRQDVFAPPKMPVLVRAEGLVASGNRVRAVDGSGAAVFFPRGSHAEDRLWGVLRDARLLAFVGDLDLDMALPVLTPLAALLEGPRGLELRALASSQAPPSAEAARAASWAEVARRAGLPASAIELGEARELLAERVCAGLGVLSERSLAPVLGRLRACGLEKPAALLEGALAKAPEGRLDDAAKVFHLLEVALVRLASASRVDPASLEEVPGFACVRLERPARVLEPGEVLRLRATGLLTRVEAAWHGDRYYRALRDDAYLTNVMPTWADSAATEHVVAALARHPERARELARRALEMPVGLTAHLTAIRVLEALGDERALRALARADAPAGKRAAVEDALDAIYAAQHKGRRVRRPVEARVAQYSEELVSGRSRQARLDALSLLFQLETRTGADAMRRAFFHDPDAGVRERAGLLLAQLGDPSVIDVAIDVVESRGGSPDAADASGRAPDWSNHAITWLGHVGDSRAVAPLLRAWAEGWMRHHIERVVESLGLVALEPIVQMLERPGADRRELVEMLRRFHDRDVTTAMLKRLDGSPGWPRRAEAFLEASVGWAELRSAVARRVLGLSDGSDDPEAAIAVRAAERALSGR